MPRAVQHHSPRKTIPCTAQARWNRERAWRGDRDGQGSRQRNHPEDAVLTDADRQKPEEGLEDLPDRALSLLAQRYGPAHQTKSAESLL